MKGHLHKLVSESVKIGPPTADSAGQAKPIVSAKDNKEQHSLPETVVKVPPSPVSDDALVSAQNQLKPTEVGVFLWSMCGNCTIRLLLFVDC